MFKQGDIIVVRYPLSDKPEKSIIRPVIIISNEKSNGLDRDVIVCQITTKLRNDQFSFLIESSALTVPMPEICEARCNKITTIRIWDRIVLSHIASLTSEALQSVLLIVRSAF